MAKVEQVQLKITKMNTKINYINSSVIQLVAILFWNCSIFNAALSEVTGEYVQFMSVYLKRAEGNKWERIMNEPFFLPNWNHNHMWVYTVRVRLEWCCGVGLSFGEFNFLSCSRRLAKWVNKCHWEWNCFAVANYSFPAIIWSLDFEKFHQIFHSENDFFLKCRCNYSR